MLTIFKNHSYVKADVYTKRFVKCPICKDATEGFYVDHLLKEAKPDKPYSFGAWECPSCHNHYDFQIHYNGDVDIAQSTKEHDTFMPCLVLLKSQHKDNPIYVMLNGKAHSTQIVLEQQEQGSSAQPYYYNSHTCPTNFIRDIIAVTFKQDIDPHGVFEFVRLLSIPDALAIAKAHPDEIELDNYDSINESEIKDTFDEHMALLFPECVVSGTDIDGEVTGGVLGNSQSRNNAPLLIEGKKDGK